MSCYPIMNLPNGSDKDSDEETVNGNPDCKCFQQKMIQRGERGVIMELACQSDRQRHKTQY